MIDQFDQISSADLVNLSENIATFPSEGKTATLFRE